MRAPEAYRVLQVPPGSDSETVRRSYRALLKRLHPDLAGSRGNPRQLDRVIEAFRVLADSGELRPPRPSRERRPRGAGPSAGASGGTGRAGGGGGPAGGRPAGGRVDLLRLGELLISAESPESRAFAARRLGGEGKRWTAAFLRSALWDSSELVVSSAVRALGELGALQCAGEFASLFHHAGSSLRHTILDAVERSGRPGAFDGVVMEALRSSDGDIRRRALRLFAQSKREARA